MNNNIKISLTIELEGSTLIRKSEPEVLNYVVTKKDLSAKHNIKDGNKVIKRKKIEYYPLVAKPAAMHINICQEAYEYMISNECPSWIKPKVWAVMNSQARLESHLVRICQHHKGHSFTYVILED